MDIWIRLYLLSIFMLVTCNGQEYSNTARDIFYLSLFPKLEDCRHEYDVTNYRCVSRVYCNGVLNMGWVENSFKRTRYSCSNTFYYLDELLSETYYAFINIQDLALLEGTYAADIVTILDLRYNKFEYSPVIPPMQHLVTLDISRNDLTTAKLYNEHSLERLKEIDLSHNKITTISVLKYERVYRQLKTIDLSNNQLVSIEDRVFSSFSKLEKLDLSFNYIEDLNQLSFDGLMNLLDLNLKHNELSEFASFLVTLSKLKKLDLSFNKIQIIKGTDFENLVELEELHLNTNSITNIEEDAFVKLTMLKVLNLSNNLLQRVPEGTWVNLPNLVFVDFSKNDLETLPKKLFKDKHITMFSVSENRLQGTLVKYMFEGLKLDDNLDLGNQQITSIEDFAFNGLVNLKKISLNYNRLQSISKKSFATLQSLQKLDLSNNRLTDIDFDKDDLVNLLSLLLQNNFLISLNHASFYGLNKLQFLDLSNNNISLVETSSFKSLKALINFQIFSNPLSGTIHEGSFEGLNSLPNLDLSQTQFIMITNESFSGMNQMKEFNASHSNISEVQFNSFVNTGLIETMDLSFNKLSYFNINSTHLGNLNTLKLNNNLLKSYSLKGLSHLTNIVISYNQLELSDEAAFEDQKDLKYLDISYNENLHLKFDQLKEITSLDSVILSGTHTNTLFISSSEVRLFHLEIAHSDISNISLIGLKNIKQLSSLSLRNNNITKIDTFAFQGVDKLSELDLSCNKITFIQPGAFKDNSLLKFLNISHNMLTAISYGVFKGLSSLKTLDMSYNEISDLENERFYEVSSLSVLIADHNKINSIIVDDFLGTNLETLSIGENPIPCHIFVNLKRNPKKFTITAIKLEENSEKENVDGVTCNTDRSETIHAKSDGNLENHNVITDIRNILHNISTNMEINNNAAINNNITRNADENTSNTSLLLESISAENKNTNILLDKILQSLSVISHTSKEYREILKSDEIMMNWKERSLTNPDKLMYSANDNLDSGFFVYSKVGVALMVVLIIMVSFISYLLYSYNKILRYRQMCSMRPSSNLIDSSSL